MGGESQRVCGSTHAWIGASRNAFRARVYFPRDVPWGRRWMRGLCSPCFFPEPLRRRALEQRAGQAVAVGAGRSTRGFESRSPEPISGGDSRCFGLAQPADRRRAPWWAQAKASPLDEVQGVERGLELFPIAREPCRTFGPPPSSPARCACICGTPSGRPITVPELVPLTLLGWSRTTAAGLDWSRRSVTRGKKLIRVRDHL